MSLCLFSCKLNNRAGTRKIMNEFSVADSLLVTGNKKLLSEYSYKILLPHFNNFDKYRKARLLNYLVASNDEKLVQITRNYLNENYLKISKCDLDSELILYYKSINKNCLTYIDNKDVVLFEEIKNNDQYYRKQSSKYVNGTKKMDSIVTLIKSADANNQKEIKILLKKYASSEIIKNDCDCSLIKTIFLVAQHSDNDILFQKEILTLFERDNTGSLPVYYTGYLKDRINMNENKEQIYGTQLKFNADKKKYELAPVADKNKLEKLRYNMNMINVKHYIDNINR